MGHNLTNVNSSLVVAIFDFQPTKILWRTMVSENI